ncbi:hypothetical protein M422DRAFT_247154 [Sphaerobolus stellatus SS14]|nr:hypothetical protein M422DRAFT_247154 [Sphaerobolus stellatus SS14]
MLPIEDSFLHYLSLVQTYQFSLISRATYRTAQEYQSYVYDVNKILRHFFSDPIAFCTLQARTGTLISGSIAVQFFTGTIWTNSDLDLYVPPKSVTAVSKWMEAQSYALLPQRPMKPAADNTNIDPEGDPSLEYKQNQLHTILSFYKINEPSKIVQINVSHFTPVDVILGFYATAPMNIISWKSAISLYPHMSFENHINLACSVLGSKQITRLMKYEAQGFEFIMNPNADTPGLHP